MGVMEDTPFLRVRVRDARGSLYRAGLPTPYFVETLLGDLRRQRAGRVEVVVRGDADRVNALRDLLATRRTPTTHVVYRRTASVRGAAA
jgi:hypothetical protein